MRIESLKLVLPLAAGVLIVLSLFAFAACSPGKATAQGLTDESEAAPVPEPASAPVFGSIGPANPPEDEALRGPEALAAFLERGGIASSLDASAGGALLLDVRTAEEYASGFIPGALLLPYDAIKARPPAFPKDGLVIVYCRSGNRSAQAKAILQGLGWKRVVDFGGLNRWTGLLARP